MITIGVDIHMHIIRKGEYVKKDIFDGRCSEWFGNMSGHGDDDVYDKLHIRYGLPEELPSDIDPEKLTEEGYYNLRHIKVKDYIDWFDTYAPNKDAGWVTTYEKWHWEKQGVEPRDPRQYLDKDDIIEDMHFIEFDKTYDCSEWLYDYIIKNSIIWDTSYIIYWFDC